MAKKAEKSALPLLSGVRESKLGHPHLNFITLLGSRLDQGIHPQGRSHPIRELLHLMSNLRSLRTGHLHALCRGVDGALPSEAEWRAALNTATELDRRPRLTDSNGQIRDGIAELIRRARQRWESGLYPFQTNDLLKSVEKVLRALSYFPKTFQHVRAIRSELVKDPPHELVDMAKKGFENLDWALDQLAIGQFLLEHFNEPYENLLALWDNLAGRENTGIGRENDNAPQSSAMSEDDAVRLTGSQEHPMPIRRADLPHILQDLRKLDDILAKPTPSNPEAVKLIAR